MKESGKTARRTDKGNLLGLMVMCMKESIKTARNGMENYEKKH